MLLAVYIFGVNPFWLVIGAIVAAWSLYKYFNAKKVIGKKVSIKSFRKNSKLLSFGELNLKVTDLKKLEKDVNWLILPLDNEIKFGENTYDFIMITPKSVDDNINYKKPVVCYVKVGNFITFPNSQFVDWGLVKIEN